MTTEDVKKLGESSTIYIRDLLELLEIYNKYAEQINKLYEPFLNKGLRVFPSTSSV
ncbi:hypothetical protein [Saccharolobus caldissimus]|uniref:Uncharacterized protein n=1 Tax=Saccharolobus caldissimus TaxID=1702097 RepID=A0AAQ4CVH5_9CREN|nr:hypothetical protein [Saccharolobus caldissimus]BDB99806.1 hypothetical protein SACC_28230 [Saccharolobus caldissimus]